MATETTSTGRRCPPDPFKPCVQHVLDLIKDEAWVFGIPAAHEQAAEPVPLHLRNAPTKLMKQLDYGKGAEYAHNDRDAVTGMDCLPPSLAGKTYYEPTERRFEKELKRRLEAWERIKQQRAAGSK